MRDETAELRALQERAYAPGGMLNEAESRRLHELQERRRRASASDAEEPPKDAAPDAVGPPTAASDTAGCRSGSSSPAASQTAPARAAPPESNLGGSSARPAVDDATLGPAVLEQPVPASDSASPRSRRRPLLALAGAALLLLGVGVGWALPQLAAQTGPSLSVEQLERRDELTELEPFDEGTMTLVKEDDVEGARVWLATRLEGDITCVIVDTGDDHGTSCLREEALENGVLSASVTIEGDDTRFESIEAAVVFSTSGEPVAQIHRFSHQTGDWLSQFPGDVRVQAEQLIEDGFDMHSVQVVGEFDGELVWTAWRDGGRERCLIVGGHNGGVACAPMDEADESGLRFVTITGDRTGAEAHVLTLHFTVWRWPYLTIETRSATGITVEEQSGQIIDVELSCPECEAD